MESIFQQNQVIWAKINGYPWWPAYIKAEIKANQFEVVFFGDFSRAILHETKIRQYDELEFKANSKNKMLNVALKSAEKIVNSESTILDEWNKIDKTVFTKNQLANNQSAKKPTTKIDKPSDDQSECLSNISKAKCHESVTKVENEEPTDFKCGNSANNNITSNTYNHFIDNKGSGDELTLIEERIEDFWINLKSDEYKSEAGVRTVNEITGRVLSIDPKLIFSSNIGALVSSCIDVCKSKAPQRQYRLTLELLNDSLTKICDYMIKEGFLMENKMTHDYIDLSKRDSIITEFYPDLPSPGLFETDMSPVTKQKIEIEAKHEMTIEEDTDKEVILVVEPRVQFRVKKKLAKVLYRDENRENVKKKVIEQLATQIEETVRAQSRSMSEYKEDILALVKTFGSDWRKANEIILGFQNGKRVETIVNELNKCANS